eukprot:gene17569-19321_t
MDSTTKGLSKNGKGRLLTSHKLGFFLIILGLVWGFYLIRLTSVYEQGHHKESELLKSKIVDLSKKYIEALSKEHALEQLSYNKVGKSHTPEMHEATTLLLRNMLDRIQLLETELHSVVVNSTLEFAKYVTNNKFCPLTDHVITSWLCEIPLNANFPECANKVAWLQMHWKSDPRYAQNGVNDSLCSILMYLSEVEHHCPKEFVKKQVFILPVATPESSPDVPIPNDNAFPQCRRKVEWMQRFWKSDPIYAAKGVDGSRESFLKYLSEVEDWCPLRDGQKKQLAECSIPKSSAFPNCGEKVAWMKTHWKVDPCYASFGVNGSICSFIKYLSEVENWCPLQPGRRPYVAPSVGLSMTVKPQLQEQRAIADLLAKLTDKNPNKLNWIKTRLTDTWPNWLSAIASLEKKRGLISYPRKQILVYIGLLADEQIYNFGRQASSGGPLGELVQWSDLIASVYLLGHALTVSVDKGNVKGLLSGSLSGYCPNSNPTQFDVIYTDYIGLIHIKHMFQNIGKMRCHIRIVDSFGTEAQFNHNTDTKLKNPFGSFDLNLKQFNTMFPHSPDNTFLGFVVGKKVNSDDVFKKKPIALVYGKHPSMWTDVKKTKFLDIVSEYFEVHATVGKGNGWANLPSYVTNHGVLPRQRLLELLRSAKVFVGMGFPFEGPAPLEAIRNGCFFLNAKIHPPLGRENSQFFKSKPTFRKLTSQHPYAERYIGLPRVHTVDLNNKTELVNTLEFMKNHTATPMLPYEFTYEGTLERLYALTKHQDFCQPTNNWPPLSNRKILVSREGMSCKDICEAKSLVCEPSYFESINRIGVMKKLLQCDVVVQRASFVAPSKSAHDNTCCIQSNKLMYSCTAVSSSTTRLCPCRDFVPGQLALCRGCIR